MATSKIKGGVQTFACTLGDGISGNASGTFDFNSGLVTIIVRAIKESNILIDDALCIVPEEYRPSASKTGAGIVINSANNPSAGMIRVLADGKVQQRSSNTARGAMGIIQYTI